MLQVMDNLISNALRYTLAGGKNLLAATEVGGNVELSVKDTGIGIDPEELPCLFDRLHRPEKSIHSEDCESGLYLAIIKALVEGQGGTVWSESVVNEGLVVKMKF